MTVKNESTSILRLCVCLTFAHVFLLHACDTVTARWDMRARLLDL